MPEKVFVGLWILQTVYMKKFKAMSSTKSQLHQPPQDNSCSAQKQPSINEVYDADSIKPTHCVFVLGVSLVSVGLPKYNNLYTYTKYNT